MRKVISGKHSIFFSLPDAPKLRFLSENQNNKAPCRRSTGEAVLCAEKPITKCSVKVVYLENNHRYAVVVQDLATNRIRAKHKLPGN